ncbi:hypothetical protein AM1_6235 [Acaryochloris marina MBIC11017]|uniref:Uncharacterized protein n=1 Tax=Acaryochloris marina (strain MBIC 11017) TaxID=329726 RepID=B0C650_ACAM1|nr:hypothetical protein AM1_6235 [Acaryochloris marina MBIC11017]
MGGTWAWGLCAISMMFCVSWGGLMARFIDRGRERQSDMEEKRPMWLQSWDEEMRGRSLF